MATYVYITDQCRKEISQQQYSPEIENFKKKVESTQSLEVFDRFPPPFLKKRFERQIRLVAREYLLKEHVVVAFLRLLVRGGKEYKQFGESDYRELPGFDGIAPEVTEEKLIAYVNGRQDPPPPPPPKPSESEASFLYSALAPSENIYLDYHCCETKLWVDTISSVNFKDWKNLFIDAVFETISCDHEGLQEVRCPKDNRFGLLFRKLDSQKAVILFCPFRGDPPLQDVTAMYEDLLSSEPPTKEIVLKKTKRAYPHELLLNEEAWLDVQNDEDGNMALSIEEIDVLESVRKPTGGFPLFINGSAGSGKSTILQYIFSEYLFHHLQSGSPTKGPILFACNNELLARSNSSIRAILRARYGRKGDSSQSNEQWLKQYDAPIASSLRNFHVWLQSLVPAGRFQEGQLFDYGRFKLWWEERFQKEPGARKLYNADVSWHVIRTYIKGISTDDYLEPDDYLEIPAKQKSVTPDTYRIVFEKVWKRYAEDQKAKGYWDHQDLARYALEENLISPEHPVVFCDEAQDFTRIELDVLHRHCLFNARTLSSFQLAQTPIAFAGDPFQTLNPTGFRWAATRAFFTDKFIKSYPGQRRGEINYQELTYNYRSSHHIVRFINSLQLTRSVIFGFPEIKPQHPWEDDENVPHVAYFEKTPETLNFLKSQSEIRIVVPCEEGFEGEWAKANGLAEYVDFDDAGVPKNVVCPTGVKGLEFPRVVLFGFGAACPPVLRHSLAKLNDIQTEIRELSNDQAIEPQYFWNRLYVAASRPRKRLFIIDSHEDISSFWNQIFSNQESTLLRLTNLQPWVELTGQVIKGSSDAWEGDQEDPVTTAKKLEDEGRLRKDRTLLRQAAQSYKTAKLPNDEKRCRAQAFELEGNFLGAAALWQELQDLEKSIAAAWNARTEGLSFIVDLSSQNPDVKNRIHWKFANHLRGKGDFSEGVAIVKELAECLDLPKLQSEILTSTVWPEMLLLVLENLSTNDANETGMWSVTYRNASRLSSQGVKLPNGIMGELAFRGGLMQQALDHWEKIHVDDRPKYESRLLQVKAATLPFPQNLETYGELLRRHNDAKFAHEILRLFQQEGRDRISDGQLPALVRAQLVLGDLGAACKEIEKVKDFSLLTQLLETADKQANDSYTNLIVQHITKLLLEQEKWDAVYDLLTCGKCDAVNNATLVTRSKADPRLHSLPIIEHIAANPGLEAATNSLKTKIAEWVFDKFPGTFHWRNEIHPLLVGKVLERTGLFRTALPYYEALASSNAVSKELNKQSWQRWAKVKHRQGTPKAQAEALERATQQGFMSVDAIPEELPSSLPSVNSILETALSRPAKSFNEAQEQSLLLPTSNRIQPLVETSYARKVTVGEFQIRVSQDGLRVNIEHAKSLQVASVNVMRRIVSVEGELIALDSRNCALLPSVDWNLELWLNDLSNGRLRLVAGDGLEVRIPVAASTHD